LINDETVLILKPWWAYTVGSIILVCQFSAMSLA
jgi:hypothetical protein